MAEMTRAGQAMARLLLDLKKARESRLASYGMTEADWDSREEQLLARRNERMWLEAGVPQHIETTKKTAAVQAAEAWDYKARPALLLVGPTGVGKSAGAIVALERIAAETGTRTPRWISAWDLNGLNVDATEREAQRCGAIVVDDLGREDTLAQRRWTSILIFRMDRKKPTIITTNLGADALEANYVAPVRDRLRGFAARPSLVGHSLR